VAAAATLDGAICRSARVALSAAGPVPLRAHAVEEALTGREASRMAIGEAAELVRGIVDPIDDFRGSADYKREMAVVFTRRALEDVLLGANT
jgi:carbon-monoxide dehydrogenase medium subunit